MDQELKAARDKARYEHSIRLYGMGFTPYLISDEAYNSMDEIELQLKEARIKEGIIITNK